jgi:ribonuclease T2
MGLAFRPARAYRDAAIAAALAALCCLDLADSVAAQDDQSKDCILDNCADEKPLAQSTASGTNSAAPAGAQAGDFDFYVLALSWSPGFCDTGGAARAHAQCASGAHLGFVVHGLWPQYQQGFPSDCNGVRSPSRLALETVEGLYPDEGLARFEWRKHGTCSGKSPTDYFADVRKARAAINVPPPFRDAHNRQNWTPIDIQRAFVAANPRLRPGMLAVVCYNDELEEVRICMSKDLHNFIPCPEVSRHFCYTQQISVAPMR